MLTVQELVDDNADKIPFSWIAGHDAADRAIPDDGMAAAHERPGQEKPRISAR